MHRQAVSHGRLSERAAQDRIIRANIGIDQAEGLIFLLHLTEEFVRFDQRAHPAAIPIACR
jgi:hypothetical protein